jgi:hypothetical protein
MRSSSISRLSRRAGVIGLTVMLALVVTAPSARADLIFLKDGFVLVGRVREERAQIVDRTSKSSYTVPKGFFFVDDGPRRFFFSPLQVQAKDRTFLRPHVRASWFRKVVLPNYQGMPVIVEMVDTPEFNDRWERDVQYRTTTYKIKVPQRLQELNSFFAAADSTKHFNWRAYYLTRELGLEHVRKLLALHPDFNETFTLATWVRATPRARADRRFHLYSFFLRAGWYKAAESTLDGMLRDFPFTKAKVEKARSNLRALQAARCMEEIRRAQRAGRRKDLAALLVKFPEKDADLKAIGEVRVLKGKLKAADKKLKEARRLLAKLLKEVKGAEQRKLFGDAVPVLLAGLHRDNLDRLELFLDHARRQERFQTKKGPTAADLLSLAVTGWLQGNIAAQTRFDVASQLWEARTLALDYLKSDDEAARKKLLDRYISQKNILGVDEVAQMLSMLPPPRAEAKLPQGVTEQKLNGITYTLQLPREYHHGRAYPVLFVLHDAKETTADMVKRWADLAGREGYILVAPHWQQTAGGNYAYSEAEHDTVLKTLGDLRQRFHVDCNRVFLFGLGQGGNMAYDVGLSHPDLFAGVLPMAAAPQYYIPRYWPNAQYLPFYVVGGDHVGDPNKWTREQLEKWIPHGYPVVFVQYKGRGMEWFGGELKPMFDWMNRKKRTTPVTQLGRFGAGAFGDEFTTLRHADNHFYWVSSNAIANGAVMPGKWNASRLGATVNAYIDPQLNQIRVNTRGFLQVTVWLARDAKVDFDKPLTVRVNGRISFRRVVKPNLLTLLEDYRRRGDRDSLFVARIELKP